MSNIMSPQASLAVGVLLLVLGFSFFYKAGVAAIKGSVLYWAGFLPFTLVSPFLIHLPAGKNSMVKRYEGIWAQVVIAPVFLVIAVLCTIAGAEYVGLPAVNTINLAVHGGKTGVPLVSFNKTRGFGFPLIVGSCPALAKFFNIPLGLDASQKMVPDNNSSYREVIEK